MANVYFKCTCDKSLAVDEKGVGRTVICPDCKEPIQIPGPSIRWTCPKCGDEMAAPEILAGGGVQCCECGADAVIPAMAKKIDVRRNEPESKKCPSCKAAIKPDVVVCIQCGFNLKTGKKASCVFRDKSAGETGINRPPKPG